MNQTEFLKKLEEALEGELSGKQIEEQISYYRNYIAQEIKNGKTEEEVMEILGDPWVISKTLIEAIQFGNDDDEKEKRRKERWERSSADSKKDSAGEEPSKWRIARTFLMRFCIILLVLTLLGNMFLLLSRILPLLLIGGIVWWLMRRP